jgi:type IV fimbrial biogenesis protein FimT
VLNGARRQEGVSLVEAMIGLTLAGILVALAVPSFQSDNQNRQIRTAAEAIQNGLHLARTEALRRNRVIRFELVDPNGWRVGCDPADPTLVDGQPACPETLQVRDASEGSRNAAVDRRQVAAGTGAETGSFEELRFTPLGRVSSLSAATNAVFRVTNPRGGACAAQGGDMRCLSIIVTTAGQIRMCDPAVAAPDPRAC